MKYRIITGKEFIHNKPVDYYYPQFKILWWWGYFYSGSRPNMFEKLGIIKQKVYWIEKFFYLDRAKEFIQNKIKQEEVKKENKESIHNWCMRHDKLYRDSFLDNKTIYETGEVDE